jgi:hypothetical protein
MTALFVDLRFGRSEGDDALSCASVNVALSTPGTQSSARAAKLTFFSLERSLRLEAGQKTRFLAQIEGEHGLRSPRVNHFKRERISHATISHPALNQINRKLLNPTI